MIDLQPEAELGTPYWWADRPTFDRPGDLPTRCDILVIGAGYTGLSAALVAWDGGADVCVVDAGGPGRGASSRNGGMFGAHPRLGWDTLRDMFGEETANGVFEEASTALTWVKDLIAREGIDCDLQETGRIQLAWTAQHLENQRRLADRVREKSAVQVEMVDRGGLAGEIATERYFGGLKFAEHCAIQPAKFHAGLLQAASAKGIDVVDHAGVTRLEKVPGGFLAKTPKGEVRADKVILCTNGYTPGPFRWHQARVFPLPSFIIATEQLPGNLIGHIAPGRRMMVETRARHSYFRISPDGTRVLWGGRASMVPISAEQAAHDLAESMLQVWPELEGMKITHSWTGNTGFTFNQMPQVGERDGVHFAMGYSGSGTVMAPYLGGKAAYAALGDPRAATAYRNTYLKTHLAHRFATPYFLRIANLWYRHWVDPHQMRLSR